MQKSVTYVSGIKCKRCPNKYNPAEVTELADVLDSKSSDRKIIRVRLPSSAFIPYEQKSKANSFRFPIDWLRVFRRIPERRVF